MSGNPENTEYGEDTKYGPKVGLFGTGRYFNLPPTFLPTTPVKNMETHARRKGWAHGCPDAINLSHKDPLSMARRYSSCNWTFWDVVETAFAARNLGLVRQLLSYTERSEIGPVGIHDPFAVPKSHIELEAPMGGLYGFGIPRILLLTKFTESHDNYSLFQDIKKRYVAAATNRDELMAGIAHDLSHIPGIKPENILEHILPQCIRDESQCPGVYGKFAQVLINTAPKLCYFYSELTSSQRRELEIATIPILNPKGS